jgi:hypothetical protein
LIKGGLQDAVLLENLPTDIAAISINVSLDGIHECCDTGFTKAVEGVGSVVSYPPLGI